MINKVLTSGYNDSAHFPAAAVIPHFNGKLDRSALRKRASIFDADYGTFERKPKHTYIHLISVAAGEQYGPNSRADFYNGESYRHDFPQPKEGGPSFIILKPGLAATHNKTFMEHGGVYTEHVSSLDGAKPQGYIVKAAINPEMKRGELIIGVETDKWSDDIQKLESGKPMKFSIGASAPYDICSICGNIAKTEDGHCDHYKSMPGEFMADGNQVYVISDNCLFHDISRVKNPAEKIAFSIRKVASGRGSRFESACGPRNLNVVRSLCKTAAAQARFDALSKLAAIEKEIIAEANSGVLDPGLVKYFKKRKNDKPSSEETRGLLRFANESGIVNACNCAGHILSPEEFVSIMLPKEDVAAFRIDPEDVKKEIPGIFGKILHSTDSDIFCNDESYSTLDSFSPTALNVVQNYAREWSLDDMIPSLLSSCTCNDDLIDRPTRVIITISNGVGRDINSTIAEDYASYLCSAAQHVPMEKVILSLIKNII